MSDVNNKTMTPFEWLLLITLSVLWGGSFFFGEVALRELGPFTVVLGRVGIAAVALLAVICLAGHGVPRAARLWGMFFMMGLLNNFIPFSLILWGQTEIASGLASILNATTPLFTVVLAHVLTADERLTAIKFAGVLAGIAGVVVMIGADALKGALTDVAAQALVLGAAVSYALASIYGRRFRDVPPMITAAGQVSASTVLILPVALIVERPWETTFPGTTTWVSLCGLALLSTALAYIIYFRILRSAGATNLALVTFLIPVSAILLGGLVLGERLEIQHFAGMALIGLGLALIDGRLFGRRGPVARRANP